MLTAYSPLPRIAELSRGQFRRTELALFYMQNFADLIGFLNMICALTVAAYRNIDISYTDAYSFPHWCSLTGFGLYHVVSNVFNDLSKTFGIKG